MPFVVYKAVSPSGKGYIGITGRHPDKRWGQHVSVALRGSDLLLHRAIRKYGADTFVRSVIAVFPTMGEACDAERLMIREHGTRAPKGYNGTDGGEGQSGVVQSAARRALTSAIFKGVPKTADHRAKISAANKGKAPSEAAIVAARICQTGRTRSEEQKARISATHKGVPKSAEHRAKIGAAHAGRTHSPEMKAAISAGRLAFVASRQQIRADARGVTIPELLKLESQEQARKDYAALKARKAAQAGVPA